jgi:hypothetical protein
VTVAPSVAVPDAPDVDVPVMEASPLVLPVVALPALLAAPSLSVDSPLLPQASATMVRSARVRRGTAPSLGAAPSEAQGSLTGHTD